MIFKNSLIVCNTILYLFCICLLFVLFELGEENVFTFCCPLNNLVNQLPLPPNPTHPPITFPHFFGNCNSMQVISVNIYELQKIYCFAHKEHHINVLWLKRDRLTGLIWKMSKVALKTFRQGTASLYLQTSKYTIQYIGLRWLRGGNFKN